LSPGRIVIMAFTGTSFGSNVTVVSGLSETVCENGAYSGLPAILSVTSPATSPPRVTGTSPLSSPSMNTCRPGAAVTRTCSPAVPAARLSENVTFDSLPERIATICSGDWSWPARTEIRCLPAASLSSEQGRELQATFPSTRT
jgi:hypothetical protein